MRIGRLPRPSIARPPAAAGKQFGLRAEVIVIAVARLYPAEVIVHYHCLNDRVINNLPPVGASIARPLPTVFLIRIKASKNLPCRCPTGGNDNNLFCTRVLFHIAANFHRRTANGRPYVSTVLENLIIVGASIARPLLTQNKFGSALKRESIYRLSH